MEEAVETARKRKNADNWKTSQEDLLVSWGEKSAGYRWMHDAMANQHRTRNDRLAYPIIILSCLCGVGGFSTVGSSTNVFIQYAFAILNITVTVLSSLQKFQRGAEMSEQHHVAACGYAKFYRLICHEMSLPPEDRTEVHELLNQSRIEYDRLLAASPEISNKTVRLYLDTFPDAKNKPDVANGITEIAVTHSRRMSLDGRSRYEDTTNNLRGFIKRFSVDTLVSGANGAKAQTPKRDNEV